MHSIVCVDWNLGIGKDGDLLYHIKEDMNNFFIHTNGKTVIMGRGTLESLPKKKLPNRHNVVLSHQNIVSDDPDIEYVSSFEEIIERYEDDDNAYVIGGESIYRKLLPYCKSVILTFIEGSRNADCFFPDIFNDDNWNILTQTRKQHDDKENVDFRFVTLINMKKLCPTSEEKTD